MLEILVKSGFRSKIFLSRLLRKFGDYNIPHNVNNYPNINNSMNIIKFRRESDRYKNKTILSITDYDDKSEIMDGLDVSLLKNKLIIPPFDYDEKNSEYKIRYQNISAFKSIYFDNYDEDGINFVRSDLRYFKNRKGVLVYHDKNNFKDDKLKNLDDKKGVLDFYKNKYLNIDISIDLKKKILDDGLKYPYLSGFDLTNFEDLVINNLRNSYICFINLELLNFQEIEDCKKEVNFDEICRTVLVFLDHYKNGVVNKDLIRK